MSTLIENLYVKSENNIYNFFNTKIKDLSYFEKFILGIEGFRGYQDNTVLDVAFVNRMPIQTIWFRYKFLRR